MMFCDIVKLKYFYPEFTLILWDIVEKLDVTCAL